MYKRRRGKQGRTGIKKREDVNIQFGQRLRGLREQCGLSAGQVADAIGIAVSTYREWENGRAITGHPYFKIAMALGVSVYQLLGIEDQRRDEISSRLDGIERLTREIRNIL